MKIPFYDDYFAIPRFIDSRAQTFKDNFLREIINDNYIFKFVPFTEDERLNQCKIELLREKKLWVSNYKNFNDINEVSMNCNTKKVSRKTGRGEQEVKAFIETTNQLNDVSCFTYETNDFMWKNYANHYNGFCIRFLLEDSDKFFPVVYIKKGKVKYTNDLIDAYKHIEAGNIFRTSFTRLSILPWVLKDKHFFAEKEIRFLCGDVFDNEFGPLGGRVFAGKKEAMGYSGLTYDYNYCGIKLQNIIVGKECNEKYVKQICEIQPCL